MGKTPDYTKKAVDNYRNKFDLLQIRLPKGTKEKIKEMGYNPNELINQLLNDFFTAAESDQPSEKQQPDFINTFPSEKELPFN